MAVGNASKRVVAKRTAAKAPRAKATGRKAATSKREQSIASELAEIRRDLKKLLVNAQQMLVRVRSA
jgi:hypothetical protein